MPAVRFTRPCTVGGRSYRSGEVAEFEEKEAADLVSMKVGHIVPPRQRTALDPAAYSARRTDRNGA